jgi:hypothetical protein
MLDMSSTSHEQMIGDLRAELAVVKRENAESKKELAELKRQGLVDHTTPTYLTEGSFGKISYFPLQTYVYKTTILGDKANGQKLEHEFRV